MATIVQGNRLYEIDPATNALLPVMEVAGESVSEAAEIVSGNRLCKIDPATNAQIPVIFLRGGGGSGGVSVFEQDVWVPLRPDEIGVANGVEIPLMEVNVKTGAMRQQRNRMGEPMFQIIFDHTEVFPGTSTTTFPIVPHFTVANGYAFLGLESKSRWHDQTSGIQGQFGAPLQLGGSTYQYNVWQNDTTGLWGWVQDNSGVPKTVRFVIRILCHRDNVPPINLVGYLTISNPNFDPAQSYPAGFWVNDNNRGYVSNKPTGPGTMDKDDWDMEPDSGSVGGTFRAYNSFIVRNGYGWFPTVDTVLTQEDSDAMIDDSLDGNTVGVWHKLAGWPSNGYFKVYYMEDGTQIWIPQT